MAEQVIDLYAILEVEPTATEKEINKAYRKLALKWHPDTCKEPNAQEMFQKITEAYDALSDKEERARYDAFVKMMKDGKGQTFEEVFNSFHSGVTGAHAPLKGEDVEMGVIFTVSEVRRRAEKEVRFERFTNCKTCEGHGFHRKTVNMCPHCSGCGFTLKDSKTPFGDIKTEQTCSECKGKGYVDTAECEECKGRGKKSVMVTLQFPLPEETTEGFRLRFKDKGDAGLNGGRNGDFIVVFMQDRNDPYRIVHDYDLEVTVDVPFKTAVMGGKVKVTIPRGETLKVPVQRGTQNGHRIIIPEEGLFNPRNRQYGGLTAIVNVEVPTNIAEEKLPKFLGMFGRKE